MNHCTICNQWWAYTHTCTGTVSQPNIWWQTPYQPDAVLLQSISEKLDKLIALLEGAPWQSDVSSNSPT